MQALTSMFQGLVIRFIENTVPQRFKTRLKLPVHDLTRGAFQPLKTSPWGLLMCYFGSPMRVFTVQTPRSVVHATKIINPMIVVSQAPWACCCSMHIFALFKLSLSSLSSSTSSSSSPHAFFAASKDLDTTKRNMGLYVHSHLLWLIGSWGGGEGGGGGVGEEVSASYQSHDQLTIKTTNIKMASTVVFQWFNNCREQNLTDGVWEQNCWKQPEATRQPNCAWELPYSSLVTQSCELCGLWQTGPATSVKERLRYV